MSRLPASPLFEQTWEVRDRSQRTEIGVVGTNDSVLTGGACGCGNNLDLEGNDESLRLAAAAPELFRALEHLVSRAVLKCPDLSGEGKPDAIGILTTREAIDVAEAALRKARGET